MVACVGSAFPGDVPKAEVLLEGFTPTLPDQAAEGAPVRFVLLETGQVYVGGTSQIAEGRLASGERKALLSRVDAVRKLPALAGRIALGPGPERYRLLLQRGRPIDMTITGDPGQAIPALQPLASLMRDLLSFHHDSLRPFQPAQYALRAREGVLPGGCRRWTLTEFPGRQREYDLILGDAFRDAYSVPYHLTTREFATMVAGALEPGGIYAVNVIDGRSALFLRSYLRTLQEVFGHVYLLPIDSQWRQNPQITTVILASDEPIDVARLTARRPIGVAANTKIFALSEAELRDFLASGDAMVLTDDRAPVENFLARVYAESVKRRGR